MEEEMLLHRYPWQWRLRLALLSQARTQALEAAPRRPANHVSWEETAAAHRFSANLPGVRKEEIRVEVEDARYLAIRTELEDGDAGGGGRRGFERKFRLPAMVDVDGISAEYARGVLTVTVPRMHTRARPIADLLAAGPAPAA